VDVMSLYPNPFSGQLTIALKDQRSPASSYIYFYDVVGRLLEKQSIQNGDNDLKVEKLPKGMIFYEVRDGVTVIGRGKVVKE